MCGIAGIVSSKRSLKPVLNDMKDSLFHRGPDNQTSYVAGNLGLIHTRLSIIDLSETANQPMKDLSDRYVIVYNGEIFNYKELKKDLSNQGIDFKTNSDTEVLLNGFIKYGIDFLKNVRGFYAFCIYDSVDQKLTLSRDFFGKKPLYFSLLDNEFIFGSEIKAITRSIQEPLEVDYQSLSHYLWKGYYANGDSAFKNIKSLKPGETIEVSLKPEIISRYIDSSQANIHVSRKHPKRDVDAVEGALKDSTSYRLVSDVPISFLLSGGVDSSLISSIASELSEAKIDTHYLGFVDKPDEFKELAEFVASKINSNHHTNLIPTPSFNEVIPKILDVFDEPFADYSSIPSLEIYKIISAKNKVAISGDGADEIFSGYKDSKLFFLSSFLPSFSLKSLSFLNFIYPLLNSSSRLLRYLSYGVTMILGNDGILSLSTNRGGWNSYFRKEFMTPEGYDLTGGDEVERMESEDFINSGSNSLERYLNYDKKRLTYDFLVKVDRTSMANSLEVRSPYLDKTIIEEIFPVHPSSLLSLKETKKELKELLRTRGLSRLANVKKMGFTPPLELWILSDESKQFLKNMISDENSIVSKLFRKDKLQILINSDKNIIRNKSRLWHLMILHQWYSEHFSN